MEFESVQTGQSDGWSAKERRQLEVMKSATPEELPCSKPQKGDFCYITVMRALEVSWAQHGDWPIFLRLKDGASFEDIQLAIHMDVPDTCPRPCPEFMEENATYNDCETARESGSRAECYSAVEWAMTTGMEENPSWYPGLGKNSSFEEVQRHLHVDPNSTGGCPMPCFNSPACHTATWDDTRPDYKACMDSLTWIQSDGIPENPDWFPGLDENSSLWDIQDHVAKDIKADVYCPIPCSDIPDDVNASTTSIE
jgi:hypothetical protein